MSDPFEVLGRHRETEGPTAAFRDRLMHTVRERISGSETEADASDTEAARNADEIYPTIALEDNMHGSGRRPTRSKLFIMCAVAASLLSIAGIATLRRDGSPHVDVINGPATEPIGGTLAPASAPTTEAPATTVGSVATTASPAAPVLASSVSISTPESAGATVIDTLPLPSSMAVDGSVLWVAHDLDSQTIDRYNADTGALLGTVAITTGSKTPSLAVGFGSMWVTTEDDLLWRVDSATGLVASTIKIPADVRPGRIVNGDNQSVSNVAVADDVVWVLAFGASDEATLVAVDPVTNSVIRSLPAPKGATNIAVGFGSLWVLPANGRLARVDPTDGRQLAVVPLASPGNYQIRAGTDAMWVGDLIRGVDSVVRIDPASNTIVATVPLLEVASFYWWSDLAFAEGYLWTSSKQGLLVKIDTVTNRVVARYGDTPGGGAVASTKDAVWFSSRNENKLYRLPLR
jgi:hypothetical protein